MSEPIGHIKAAVLRSLFGIDTLIGLGQIIYGCIHSWSIIPHGLCVFAAGVCDATIDTDYETPVGEIMAWDLQRFLASSAIFLCTYAANIMIKNKHAGLLC